MSKNLDHAYDEYLKAHDREAVQAINEFQEKIKAPAFKYGRFTIPTFYKAYFPSPSQEKLLKNVASNFYQIINTAARLYFEEPHVSHLYKLPKEADELVRIDPGYSQSVVFARLDAFLEGDSLKLVEFNCDSPAGAAYSDQIENLLVQETFLKDFVDENHIMATDRAEQILKSLLGIYEEFGGYETPQIAIIDWKHIRTKPEFEYLKHYFETKGYKTTIADPRELKYKGGRLYHKNFKIQLILRRVIFDELLNRLDEVGDLIQAYKDKAVCMVNPLRSRVASSKAILSLLTNPEYEHFFTENENKLKEIHIPWTRRIVDAEDFYGGKKVYLIDFLKDEKETLVLKPAAGYGGRDVKVGKELPDEEWNEAIGKALKEDWVVQEYVNVPIMTVPQVVNKELDFSYKKFNFNLFVFSGRYTGGFARLSDESVINVARGGGLIPALRSDFAPDRFGV